MYQILEGKLTFISQVWAFEAQSNISTLSQRRKRACARAHSHTWDILPASTRSN